MIVLWHHMPLYRAVLCSRRARLLEPTKAKQKPGNPHFLAIFRVSFWCARRDLNPYVINTRPSNVPVCQFQHSRLTQRAILYHSCQGMSTLKFELNIRFSGNLAKFLIAHHTVQYFHQRVYRQMLRKSKLVQQLFAAKGAVLPARKTQFI